MPYVLISGSFSDLLIVKCSDFLAGMCIIFPVLGLGTDLARRCLTLKQPNPLISIRSPFSRASAMAVIIMSADWAISPFRKVGIFFDIQLISSFLSIVIVSGLIGTLCLGMFAKAS